MAFCARTTRENAPAERGYRTSSHVGPGAYESEATGPKWTKKPSYAPFSSTSARETIAVAHQLLSNPGPGAYGQRKPRHFKTQSFGSSFKSHTKRFGKADPKRTPGPGAYAIRSKWVRGKRNAGPPPAASSNKKGPIEWTKMASAPSIPGTNEKFGYSEATDGRLLKQKPSGDGHSGTQGDTVGPGDYSPNQERTNKHRRAQAVLHFGRCRTQRTDFTMNRAPGPGKYTLPTKPAGVSDLIRKKANAAFQSQTQRTKLSAGGRNVPGPGTYQKKTSFERVDKVPANLQFFGSTSKRFQRNALSASGQAIGPGSYNTGLSSFRSGLARGRAHPTVGSVGFSSTTSRFQRGPKADASEGPGPAAYTSSDKWSGQGRGPARKAPIEIALDTPFGSSTSRFTDSSAHAVPGPGTYRSDFKSLESKRVADKSSSVFTSRTSRMLKKKVMATPDPGHYDLKKSWISGNRASGLLGYGAGSRFSDGATMTPGPGTYKAKAGAMDMNESSTNRKMVMVSVEPRFRQKKVDKVPGPGEYSTDHLYGNLNTRTFNMSIAEEMYT